VLVGATLSRALRLLFSTVGAQSHPCATPFLPCAALSKRRRCKMKAIATHKQHHRNSKKQKKPLAAQCPYLAHRHRTQAHKHLKSTGSSRHLHQNASQRATKRRCDRNHARKARKRGRAAPALKKSRVPPFKRAVAPHELARAAFESCVLAQCAGQLFSSNGPTVLEIRRFS